MSSLWPGRALLVKKKSLPEICCYAHNNHLFHPFLLQVLCDRLMLHVQVFVQMRTISFPRLIFRVVQIVQLAFKCAVRLDLGIMALRMTSELKLVFSSQIDNHLPDNFHAVCPIGKSVTQLFVDLRSFCAYHTVIRPHVLPIFHSVCTANLLGAERLCIVGRREGDMPGRVIVLQTFN